MAMAISSAAWSAPPCNLPNSVPIEAEIQDWMGARLLAQTRPAKVPQLKLCSICSIWAASSMRPCSALGLLPWNMVRKFSWNNWPGTGCRITLLWLRRWWAAIERRNLGRQEQAVLGILAHLHGFLRR